MIDFTTSQLGVTEQLIQIDRKDDFINLLLAMSRQTKHRILLFSHDLDESLFASNELYEIFKKLAIQNNRTYIEILVQDSMSITKNNHPLLELSRRISSHVSIKLTSKKYSDVYETFIIFDDCAYIIQEHPDRYEANGNFSAPAKTKQLRKKFEEMWQRGIIDSSLRQLSL